ncbi:hypothetical protein C7N43_29680 [Sphingobacteriales bacterium UPWRP_1]|nr:hypothetical protein BVG80_13735 [Sphingobacteriales bacterium TSM_CSM]PSJ73334.1 hypothetical protein C7N43_29680 [Sphingobacteriales bacterium UPWRP_1]
MFCSACKQEYVPKPKAYPRIIFPEHSYTAFNSSQCPFTFEYPVYGKIIKNDSLLLVKKAENPCWMNIDFADFNADLYLSYRQIDSKEKTLPKLINDAYTMNAKHVIKADFIEDSLFVTQNRIYGVFYSVGGDAASAMQFYLTDSLHHFMWASFYVKATPNEDSIAPVNRFFEKDLQHLINSFKWK